MAYRNVADDPERVAEHATRFDQGTASTVMDFEYLLLTARTCG